MGYRVYLSGLFLGTGLLLGVLTGNPGLEQKAEMQTAAETALLQETGGTADSLSLHALSAVLIDGDSGRVLYGKEETTFRPMASTTKIMTCILALENGNLSDLCTVSETAAAQPKVHLGASKGTQFYLKDLLYSLMLESHNDSAVMIAEQIGGSVERFADMMNQKARDIGCENTCFVTPNGLDAAVTGPDGREYVHGTTAEDLAKILRYCISDSPVRKQFLEITQTTNYSFQDAEKKRSYQCTNHNAFLTMMEGAVTGKTGFTGGAGYSYVAALEDEGRTYIIALLGSGWPPHKTYKWSDARTLFGYGKEQYHYRDIYEEPEFNAIPVENGVSEPSTAALTLGLREEEKHLNMLLKEDEQVKRQLIVPDVLEAPVKAGELVGNMVYRLNGEIIKTYPVYTAEAIARRDLPYCIRQIWNLFFLPE